MIYELDPGHFEKARPVFAGLDRVAIGSILAGTTPARIFVDDLDRPQRAFIWNAFRYGFLAGDPHDEQFNTELINFLRESLFPEARNSSDPTLVLYPDSNTWNDVFDNLLRVESSFKAARKLFHFERLAFGRRIVPDIPPGFRLQRIDEAFLNGSGKDLSGFIRLFWNSIPDFLAQGFGFCLLHGNRLASTCCAAFVSGGKAEIDISTEREYQRRGFAMLTAGAFIEHCLRSGLEPAWECWDTNTPSTQLAEKLGFEHNSDCPVRFIDLA